MDSNKADMDSILGRTDNIFSNNSHSSRDSIFFGNKDTVLGNTFNPPVWF